MLIHGRIVEMIKKLFVWVLFFLIFSSNSTSTAQDYVKERFYFEQICKDIRNSHECAQAIECYQIKRYSKYFSRQNNQLKIKLKNGKILALKDSLEDDVDGKWYNFREYLQDVGYFVIHVQYYEGNEYLMINDKTGKEYRIFEIPHISPDKRRFVSVSASEAYNPNGVWIWRFTPGGLVNELSYEPKEYSLFTFVSWENNKTIKLSKYTHDPKRSPIAVPALLKLEANEWKFFEEPIKGGKDR
jgi:hypothetical protein